MPKRPCLDCNRLHGNASRCDACATRYMSKVDAKRGSATKRGYGSSWQRVSRDTISNYIAINGDVCHGYRVPPHHTTDLTVDHVIPKSRGGTDHPSNLQVLCRGCNTRKRHTQ